MIGNSSLQARALAGISKAHSNVVVSKLAQLAGALGPTSLADPKQSDASGYGGHEGD